MKVYGETTVIYADVLFLINFFIDGVCLFITAVTSKLELKRLRLICACVVGGLYSIFALYAEIFPDLLQILLHVSAVFALCFTAFGFRSLKELGKTVLVYFMVSSLLGGVLYAVYSAVGKFALYEGYFYTELSLASLGIAILLCAGAVGVFYYNLKKSSRTKTAMLSFSFRGMDFKVDCFADSGNLLLCPYSGRHVILVKPEALSQLGTELIERLKMNELSQGFRLIPVKTPAGSRLLVSFLPERAEIKAFGERKGKSVSVALAVDFSEGTYGGMTGLAPAVLI